MRLPKVLAVLPIFSLREGWLEDFERMYRIHRVSLPPLTVEAAFSFEDLRILTGREELVCRFSRDLAEEVRRRVEEQLSPALNLATQTRNVPDPSVGFSMVHSSQLVGYERYDGTLIVREPPTTSCFDCAVVVPVTEIWTGRRSGCALCEACVDRRVAGGRARKLTEEEAAAKEAGEF